MIKKSFLPFEWFILGLYTAIGGPALPSLAENTSSTFDQISLFNARSVTNISHPFEYRTGEEGTNNDEKRQKEANSRSSSNVSDQSSGSTRQETVGLEWRDDGYGQKR